MSPLPKMKKNEPLSKVTESSESLASVDLSETELSVSRKKNSLKDGSFENLTRSSISVGKLKKFPAQRRVVGTVASVSDHFVNVSAIKRKNAKKGLKISVPLPPRR